MRRCAHFVVLFGLVACSSSKEIVVGRVHLEPPADAAPSRTPDPPPDSLAVRDAEANFTPRVDAASEPDASASPAESDAGSGLDASMAPTMTAECTPPALLHDYLFSGSGTQVMDRAGEHDAELVGGASLQPAADEPVSVELDGEDDYVQLPAGLLADLQSVTLSLWFELDGGPGYVRMLDFGMGSTEEAVEGDGSVGRSYLAITPATGLERTGLAALASASGAGGEVAIDTELEVRDAALHQVTLVVDGEKSQLRLYLDGTSAGQAELPFALAEIIDQNNWLGRSQYDADPYFGGRLYHFEVFGSALSDCQVAADWQRGVAGG